MASFYHIYLKKTPGTTDAEVQQKMDLALDWFKYAPNNWVVYTTSNARKWQARLRPLAEPGGNVLILKLDTSDRQGWLDERFWVWLKEDRRRTSGPED